MVEEGKERNMEGETCEQEERVEVKIWKQNIG